MRLGAYLAAAAVLGGGFFGWGYLRYNAGFNDGEAAVWAEVREVEQQKQIEVFQLAETLSRRTAELEAARASRVELIERLENEALADDPTSRVPSDNSLRRLEARWN